MSIDDVELGMSGTYIFPSLEGEHGQSFEVLQNLAAEIRSEDRYHRIQLALDGMLAATPEAGDDIDDMDDESPENIKEHLMGFYLGELSVEHAPAVLVLAQGAVFRPNKGFDVVTVEARVDKAVAASDQQKLDLVRSAILECCAEVGEDGGIPLSGIPVSRDTIVRDLSNVPDAIESIKYGGRLDLAEVSTLDVTPRLKEDLIRATLRFHAPYMYSN